MRRATGAFSRAVTHGAASQIEVTAWLGTRNLGRVPVVGGSWSLTDSADEKVPGLFTFDVPNTRAWQPTRFEHPLAGKGHRFRVRVGVRPGGSDRVEWLNAGTFLADPPVDNGDVMQVTASGMLKLVEESRLLSPLRLRNNPTRRQAVTQLLQGILPFRVLGLADERIQPWTCERDRLDGLREHLDAWPARITIDDLGVALIRPPVDDDNPGPIVKTFSDGEGGTLMSCKISRSTQAQYNAYRVANVPENDQDLKWSTWRLRQGNFRWGGPYGYRPGFYESPLLPADTWRLNRIAKTMTLRSQRRTDAYEITAAPDVRVQPDDVVRVTSSAQGLDIMGRVVDVTHTWNSLTAKVSWISGVR